MQITTERLGKRFRREWIFRNVDLTLLAGNSYTFVGPNGSGKSTLLQTIAGVLPASEGTIRYSVEEKPVEIDDWFRHLVIAAPYLELIEELTLLELLTFHQSFKPFKNGITPDQLCELMYLNHARNKEIKAFSSGMKQRVKLGLAFYSDASIVILDEPTSNLDKQGVAWYSEQVRQLSGQLLLIGSNQPDEYDFCPNVIDISRWK
ncbi:ABC transporter ATP-binding protein [Larkinella rosea]|uniref:ATP-binding cassette domain-containing protein n=1 Tax=Larkinella rosea TaxID=2025312 RepID=A0A3P1B950_9BACT|nr:ATP-binding cassette domain-containing protein [Larkinella rosea]RRA97548.1 ATP-binding cassette domain-containing protein [Larkinella rosea]